MKTTRRDQAVAACVCTLALLLVFAFQNCAPALPSDEGYTSVKSTRATATPYSVSATSTPGTGYVGAVWQGVCVSDYTADPMSLAGSDLTYGPLVSFKRADGYAAFWSMNYNAVSHATVCHMAESGWSVAATGDFNFDLQQDVLWRNTDGRVIVWQMSGASRNGGGPLATRIDPSWNVEAVADFTGDSKADILWRKPDGTLVLWAMNGAAEPTVTSFPSNLDLSWHIAGVADFNGDHLNDILWRNDNGAVKVWLMNGTTVTTDAALSTPTVATNWVIKAVGDFSGDGRADIFWQNMTDLTCQMWMMNGATVVTTANIAAVDAAWSADGAVDLDSDGRTDILWTVNSGTKVLGAWKVVWTSLSARTFNAIQGGWGILKYAHL